MARRKKSKDITVIYKKLGKERAFGQADYENRTIEIDDRLKGKKHLEILLHEAYHILHPKLAEEVVVQNSVILTNLLWEECYRRVEDDDTIPLQNEI